MLLRHHGTFLRLAAFWLRFSYNYLSIQKFRENTPILSAAPAARVGLAPNVSRYIRWIDLNFLRKFFDREVTLLA